MEFANHTKVIFLPSVNLSSLVYVLQWTIFQLSVFHSLLLDSEKITKITQENLTESMTYISKNCFLFC